MRWGEDSAGESRRQHLEPPLSGPWEESGAGPWSSIWARPPWPLDRTEEAQARRLGTTVEARAVCPVVMLRAHEGDHGICDTHHMQGTPDSLSAGPVKVKASINSQAVAVSITCTLSHDSQQRGHRAGRPPSG